MNQTRQIITATTAAILVTTTLFAGAVVAQPGVPINFYGSVEDAGGQPAPEGTEVFALVNGSVEDSIEVSPTGQYGGPNAFDDKLSVNSGAGDTVVFRANSPTGPEASETVSVEDVNGSVQQDLTFPSGTFASGAETPAGGGGGGAGGGGGGAGGGGGGAGGAGDPPPSIQEIRSTLNLVEPSTTTETGIQDSDPDTPGTSVTLEGTESVRSITFDSEGVTGSVQVREYSNPPEEIRTQVAESITGSGALGGGDSGDGADGSDTGDSGDASVNVISVSDITPTSEEAEDSSATVELSVPASEVDNPNQVTVVKETYDFEAQQDTWSQLETTVEDVGEDEITVSARAESFSLFAVAEVDQDGAQQIEGDGQQDDQPGDGLSPTTIVLGILAILVVGGFLIYVRNTDS